MNKKKQNKRSLPYRDSGDDMLDKDGVIVEPDVRKSISSYFDSMRMRETTYALRSTFFANPYEDPQDDYENHDDPVGLKLMARKRKIEDEIKGESLVRKLVNEMINESNDPPPPENLGIVTFKYSFHSKLTVIYSIPALDWSLSRLFGTSVPKPNPDDLVISGVQWGKPNGEGGPCNYAYVVRRSATAFKDWGRKAYLAALAAAGEMGPDRDIVKPGAIKAWQRIIDAGYVEAHPYDDIKNPQTPPLEDDCDLHPDMPILNASYNLKGSIPSDISEMQERGRRHFEILETHGGKEVVDMARKLIGIEYDTIFRKKYEGENF